LNEEEELDELEGDDDNDGSRPRRITPGSKFDYQDIMGWVSSLTAGIAGIQRKTPR
jgi:hypothetical protein